VRRDVTSHSATKAAGRRVRIKPLRVLRESFGLHGRHFCRKPAQFRRQYRRCRRDIVFKDDVPFG
jgi:hypothetical protein